MNKAKQRKRRLMGGYPLSDGRTLPEPPATADKPKMTSMPKDSGAQLKNRRETEERFGLHRGRR